MNITVNKPHTDNSTSIQTEKNLYSDLVKEAYKYMVMMFIT